MKTKDFGKEKATKFRWFIVFLLFFITIVNYIDRSAISYAIPDITKEMGLTASQKGLILGAFGIGYLVMTFFGGILADRFGARWTLLVMSILWSLSIGLTGLSISFSMVFIMRIVLGVAEGPNFPAMSRSISDWLSRDERAIALSNSLVSVPIALAIGAPIVTNILAAAGWRWMFIILGIVGLAWVPVWFFTFKDHPKQSRFVNEAELRHIRKSEKNKDGSQEEPEKREIKGLWRFLLTNKTLMANNWSFFVFGFYLFFFMTWLPSYLEKAYGMNLKAIGWFTVIPWLFAALLLWGVGYLSDGIYKKTGSLRLSRSYPIWISQLLSAICTVPIIFIQSEGWAITFITLAVGFAMSSNATFYAINNDIANERAGTALGIMDTFFAAAGFIAPWITGLIVGATNSFTSAFWLLAILALSSVLAVFFFHKPDESRTLENVE